ncbi:MAG: hypothetical protein EOM91_07070 [Sphingobacteriia bacterium]|nr:hypothetical protein [Sphingobacteriia bacterium]NCC38903.1 hypothetical protein [Gammaproteobacteria bacterium]
MRRARASRQRGASLTEALVALVILSVGLLALAQLQMRVLASSGFSKAQTSAINLAQETFERLRASAYDEIHDGSDWPPIEMGHTAVFARAWSVTEDPDLAFKTIRITTAWQSIEGIDQSVTLTGIIARGSP